MSATKCDKLKWMAWTMADKMNEMDYGLKEMRWNMNNEVDNARTKWVLKLLNVF